MNEIYLSKIVRIIVMISFAIFSFAVFWDEHVTSQKEQAEQDNNMSDSTQEKRKKKDDGFQKFIDILNDDNKEIPDSKKVEAIKYIGRGDYRLKRAIPVLMRYLDFEDVAVHKRFIREGQINITEYNDVSPSMLFPAVGTLMQFGHAALPALVEVIENESPDSTRSKNARQTVQSIFLVGMEGEDNLLKGVLYLEKMATQSKAPNGSQNLLLAARQLMELNERLGRPPQ